MCDMLIAMPFGEEGLVLVGYMERSREGQRLLGRHALELGMGGVV